MTTQSLASRGAPRLRLMQLGWAGIQIACIAGAITTLSSIKWIVASQTVQGLLYVVSLSSLGMRCQCEANQNGKKICKHVVGVYTSS